MGADQHDKVFSDLVPQIQDADILAYNFYVIDESGQQTSPIPECIVTDKVLNGYTDSYYELFHGRMSDGVWNKIAKKSLWDQVIHDIPNHHIVMMEDFLFSMYLLYNAKKVVTTSYVGYGYFMPPVSSTKFTSMSDEQ